MKKLNLIRTSACWNPMTAITEKGEAFELDNIIIYSEDGALIETDCGWFRNGNNDIEEGLELTPIKRKIKVDFNCKENFVTKSEQKEYKFDAKYTLYLYYKNVDYKYEGLSLDSLFLSINYSILNNTIKSYQVIGDREKLSDSIQYAEELKEAMKNINNYNFDNHSDILKKSIDIIKKYHKKFEQAKEYEKTLTVDNWKELIRDYARKFLENNKKLEK